MSSRRFVITPSAALASLGLLGENPFEVVVTERV